MLGWVGIRVLTLTLAIAMVIVTAGVVGGLLMYQSDKAVDAVKETGRKGVNDSFAFGTQNTELMTGRYLSKVLDGVIDNVERLILQPVTISEEMMFNARETDPDILTDPEYLEYTMLPRMMSKIRAFGPSGAVQIWFLAYPWSNKAISLGRGDTEKTGGTGDWGGLVVVQQHVVEDLTPPGRPSVYIAATQRRNGRVSTNETHIEYGRADNKGVVEPGPCNAYPNYTAGEKSGICYYHSGVVKATQYWQLVEKLLYKPELKDEQPSETVFVSDTISITAETGIMIYAAFRHPDMPDLSGYGDNRVGGVAIILTMNYVADIFKQQDLPAGSLLYALEYKTNQLTVINVGPQYQTFTIPGPDSEIYRLSYPYSIDSYPNEVVTSHAQHVRNVSSYAEMSSETNRDNLNPFLFTPSNVNVSTPLPDVLYWTRISELKVHTLHWYVTLLVEREVVMKTIDEATLIIKAQIDDEYQQTEDEQFDDRLVTLYVLIGCSLALVGFSVIFSFAIVSPLYQLQRDMAEVAHMHLEAIDSSRPLSLLCEVAAMQISFLSLVKNLVEYRNYMPQSVLVESDVDESDDLTEPRVRTDEVEIFSDGDQTQTTRTSGRLSATSGSNNNHIPGSMSKASALGKYMKTVRNGGINKKTAIATASDSLKRKNCSFAVFNVKNWHTVTSTTSEQELIWVHSDLMSLLLSSVNQMKGVPETFSGDRLMACFNSVIPCASHQSNAAACANDFQLKLLGIKFGSDQIQLRSSAAVCAGEVRIGNMGCPGMKKFTHLGPVVTWVNALERYARSIGIDILLDNQINTEAEHRFYFRSMGCVHYGKRSQRPLQIFELKEAKTIRDTEWMYQLEEGSNADPYSAWNKFVKAIVESNWTMAEQYFIEPNDVPGGATTVAMDNLAKIYQTKAVHWDTIVYH
eukprot:TRINITY_DN1046_c0_g1_i1.p1 TRINITY_DN1046_c0_g1~~TRINITY_DN1046_c0_g1_i1.p1  ORF type:complete len:914 (+),score=145.41 TRINITY_DN1046_c0_g1_i1:58-2799(+)